MKPLSQITWIISPHCRWYRWGDETCAYLANSGDLHLLNRVAGQVLAVLSDSNGIGRTIINARDLEISDAEFHVTTEELEDALVALNERHVIWIDAS